MMDYHACVWPSPLVNGEEPLAQRFDSLNEPGLSNLDSILEIEEDDSGVRPPLITFSHFLPIQVHLCELSLQMLIGGGKGGGVQKSPQLLAIKALDCVEGELEYSCR